MMTIRIVRPEKRNAIDGEVLDGLRDALAIAAIDPSVRGIVLTGAGDVFSAGVDINWFRSEESDAHLDPKATRLCSLFNLMARFPKPMLARVNGSAYGGGIGLFAACDVVIADETAEFGFTEVHVGLIPGAIVPPVMRRVGGAVAGRLFITGERFSSEEAQLMGLVDRLAVEGALDEIVAAEVSMLLKGGPGAQQAVKSLLREIETRDRSVDVTDVVVSAIERQRESAEAAEGAAAFLEKRTPSWQLK